MRRITILFIVFISSFLNAQTQLEPLNVLFVGNSITYFNNLPQTFKAIAEEQGYFINLEQHTPGGTGFINHVGNATLYNKFNTTVWDYVILQPGSNESPAYSQPLANTINRAKTLRDKIYENSPCASIYLYEISYGIVNNTAGAMQQYLDRQLLIKNNLIQMSNETNIPLVPVGETFQTSIQQNDSHFLWGGYGDIHPNAKGSFMGACTFYNALFQKPIVNSTVNATLSQADADYFRNIAQSVTLNNFSDWNIDTLVAHANFTFALTNNSTINFTNTSTNFDTVSWNFGDGTTSTDLNPTHELDFNIQPEYKVVLTALKGCKEHHYMQKITQSSLGVLSNEILSDFKVFPNPVKYQLHLSMKSNTSYSYKLYDVLGNLLQAKSNQKGLTKLNTSQLQQGVYLLKVNAENKQKTLKVIKD